MGRSKKQISKAYYEKNKKKILEKRKRNKDRINSKAREYYRMNKDKIKARVKKNYYKQKGEICAKKRDKYANDATFREAMIEYSKKYYTSRRVNKINIDKESFDEEFKIPNFEDL